MITISLNLAVKELSVRM